MNLVYFCGFLLLVYTCMSQARQTASLGGWIPLTEEEVYSKSRFSLNADSVHTSPIHPKENLEINIIGVPKTDRMSTGEDRHIHNIRNKAIKLVKPEYKSYFGHENIFKPIEPETIKSVNELQNIKENNIEHEKVLTGEATLNIPNAEQSRDNVTDLKLRKSKAILESHSNNNINELLLKPDSKLCDIDNSKRRFTKDIGQDEDLYRVTEDPDEELGNDESSVIKTAGYFYTPPDLNLHNPAQNNITHTFLDILSRHNIKPEDDLPNYTLSRKIKAQSPATAFMLIPVPLRVLPQFNNLKQLSVDPLLAVLMSNYGYYFPGSYGIHSRYRNLYGHLASNNIHNNKPFGSYKIFSDTDSSN